MLSATHLRLHMRKVGYAWLGILISLAASAAEPAWHWRAQFGSTERAILRTWVSDAQAGLERLVGPLDYRFDVYFHRRSGRGPVPWAETNKRGGRRSVYFHVNLRGHTARQLRRDWTASHELSHLMFPYLGRDGAWFAEGIASYLQYQAMYAAGELSWDEAMARYRERFARAARVRSATPIAHMPRRVRGRGGFVRMYWGGAAYFLHADRALQQAHGMRLNQLIERYLACCFDWRDDERDLIAHFDRLAGTTLFSELYRGLMHQPRFPETATALAWLAENPPLLKE